MTLDVTIGKITEDTTKSSYKYNVNQMPDADHDICNPAFTIYSKEAYRSGPRGFWEFWEHYCNELYFKLRDHPHTNDRDVARLQPYIDEINALADECDDDKTSEDMMVWFKYWANKAVEQYGYNAGIKFS